MRFEILIFAFFLLGISQCQAWPGIRTRNIRPVGRYTAKEVDQENVETARLIMKNLLKTNSALEPLKRGQIEQQLSGSESKLVKYTTQVVAGMNYGLIFYNGNNFTCFKIYRSLDRQYKLTEMAKTKSLGSAMTQCRIR